MTDIGLEEETALLEYLFEHGASTERTLEQALGDVRHIVEGDIADWAVDAEDRGLIEQVQGSTAVRRWQITDDGRRVIGNEPGR